MNVVEVATLMSEAAREEFLGRGRSEKALFPQSWKLPDEEVRVTRQGSNCLVFDTGGDWTFTLFLDSGSVAPRKRGDEFQW
ncbi:MAG: hypothetical protein PHQ42_05505 [Patescibacteria group bacterium]|nr:hypothetical protein [Patescibacteria group bacterium]